PGPDPEHREDLTQGHSDVTAAGRGVRPRDKNAAPGGGSVGPRPGTHPRPVHLDPIRPDHLDRWIARRKQASDTSAVIETRILTVRRSDLPGKGDRGRRLSRFSSGRKWAGCLLEPEIRSWTRFAQ